MGGTCSRFLKALLVVSVGVMFVTVSAQSTAQKKKKKKKNAKADAAMVETAEAGAEEEAETPDPQEVARDHYNRGKQAYDNGDFATAETEFQSAYDIKPHPAVLKSIAECKIQLGKNVEAIALLEQLTVDEDYGKKADIEARLAQARAEVSALDISSNPPGASVEVNGTPLKEKTPAKVYVIPGDQNVVVRMDGYDDQTKELTVEKGSVASVSVDFTATDIAPTQPDLIDPFAEEDGSDLETGTAAEEDSGPPRAFWAMAAITGVGLVSGTVFGTMALSAQSDYEDNPDQATKDSGERSAIIADISFGVAIAAAVAGTIILVANNKKKKESSDAAARVTVSPIVSPDTMGLASAVTF